MSDLGSLLPEESELLIALPYRVGVWMSHADDDDGEGDDAREMKALEGIIKSVAKAHEGSGFVQDVAQEILRLREHWSGWEARSFNILPDCEKVMGVLKGHVNDNDRKAYRAALLQIAETVAQAHGEFGMDAGDDVGAWGGFLEKVVNKLKGEGEDAAFMNISPAEDDALNRLSVALQGND